MFNNNKKKKSISSPNSSVVVNSDAKHFIPKFFFDSLFSDIKKQIFSQI